MSEAGNTTVAAARPFDLTMAAERKRAATRLVNRYSLWAVGAGLLPLPVFDLAALTGLHLSMMARLSEMYGVRYSEEIGKTFVVPLITGGLPFF